MHPKYTYMYYPSGYISGGRKSHQYSQNQTTPKDRNGSELIPSVKFQCQSVISSSCIFLCILYNKKTTLSSPFFAYTFNSNVELTHGSLMPSVLCLKHDRLSPLVAFAAYPLKSNATITDWIVT